MAKKEKVNTTYQLTTGAQKQTAKAEKVNPVGVALAADVLSRLDQIATEVGVNRHLLMIYAIKDFIKRYEQGERPRTTKKEITVLEP
jgi:metal-responsive CopG/Arc/MetJ family transcriptional regulator